MTTRSLIDSILILLVVQLFVKPGQSWQQCSEEQGGGNCPDRATCCRTSKPGVSSCISSRSHTPDGGGHCCDDLGDTGCGYGYQCTTSTRTSTSDDDDARLFCQLTDRQEKDMPNQVPRYHLCHVPQELQALQSFPIRFPAGESKSATFHLAYYSNMQAITVPTNQHFQVETVIIMIHGSGRNADDYFCAALSLLDDDFDDTVLVIAPKFASPQDGDLGIDNLLVWTDDPTPEHPLAHSWRYGADSIHAPISSYGTLDKLVDYLVQATVQFPNLKRVVVAGHSAGGQIAHRWALLSNSPAWNSTELRSVVANPRSYCYLDNRRISNKGTFNVPDDNDITACPGYNQWQWGLEPGGTLIAPYKDQALNTTPTQPMAQRYATRNVIYLTGEHDEIPLDDHCETNMFQGKNRHERAKHYSQALRNYFGRKVHQLHQVPGSFHDHTLMFQSEPGRNAIFGAPSPWNDE